MFGDFWNHRLRLGAILFSACGVGVASAFAQAPIARNQPIEITADKLDVFQEQHQAIFTGNVLAVQGDKQMRAAEMIVHYRDAKTSPDTGGKNATDAQEAQGISRIDAQGNVVFTTPKETAQGDKGVYEVDSETITLTGGKVILTREKNVLQGTKLIYQMATGRSVLTSGGVAVNAAGETRPARVKGLFIPKSGEDRNTP